MYVILSVYLCRYVNMCRHYFVECLEAEEWPEEHAADIRQSKESVIGILQHSLPAAAPNLAHYLLGYTMSEQVGTGAGASILLLL